MSLTRPGRAQRALAVGTVLAALVAGPWASGSMREDLLRKMNRKREGHGLRELEMSRHLAGKARRHTRRMIRLNNLFHSRSAILGARRLWGENVGCGPSLRRLFRSLMHSPSHRANILRPGFRRVGIGVVEARGLNLCGRRSLWTTQIFRS